MGNITKLFDDVYTCSKASMLLLAFEKVYLSYTVYTRPSEVNQYCGGGGGGGSRINLNKSELVSHFSSSLVCLAYTNGNN
jgi:hypothetical protein